MMPEPLSQEERIQSLADILSMVAIIGRVDKAAVQRVLIALGSSLFEIQSEHVIDYDLARRLLMEIARESGEDAALQLAGDITFVARAWRPVLDEYQRIDPYRLMPYAEILYALVNYTGVALHEHEAFERFGGPDVVLPMLQMSAALAPYPVPVPGLKWEMVGFSDPSDQALVGSDANNIYLFKAASSGIDLRFSELERGSEGEARRQHDIRVDSALFAAFIAGLLGDMLYWAARLRSHTLPGQDIWDRLQTLLVLSGGAPAPMPVRPPAQAVEERFFNDQPADESPGQEQFAGDQSSESQPEPDRPDESVASTGDQATPTKPARRKKSRR
jgi:hypothetical protein